MRRILLVPLANDSRYPHATFEFQESLAARLQCAGRFEVVLATPDTHLACHDGVRINGRFDEAELLRLADEHHADAVLFGAITQYHPYLPPRVGLSLRLISPANAALIASVDGLWDARDQVVADQARYYTGHVLNDGQSLMSCELTMDSPALFRRFACHYAVEALVSPVLMPATNAGPTQPMAGSNPISTVQAAQSPTTTAAPFPPPVPPVPPSSAPVLPALPIELPDEPSSPNEGDS